MEPTENKELIYGWGSAQEVADHVFHSSADILLEGFLIFAYRHTEQAGPFEVIVSQRVDSKGYPDKNNYAVLIHTSGWSGIIPYVREGFISDSVVGLLKEHKADKMMISALEATLIDKNK